MTSELDKNFKRVFSFELLLHRIENTKSENQQYSKILLEAEQLKFENGEGSVFMINARENKLLETELKLAEYKLKFVKIILNLIYLNGTLNYKL